MNYNLSRQEIVRILRNQLGPSSRAEVWPKRVLSYRGAMHRGGLSSSTVIKTDLQLFILTIMDVWNVFADKGGGRGLKWPKCCGRLLWMTPLTISEKMAFFAIVSLKGPSIKDVRIEEGSGRRGCLTKRGRPHFMKILAKLVVISLENWWLFHWKIVILSFKHVLTVKMAFFDIKSILSNDRNRCKIFDKNADVRGEGVWGRGQGGGRRLKWPTYCGRPLWIIH